MKDNTALILIDMINKMDFEVVRIFLKIRNQSSIPS